jgi:hypothetical protein
MRRARNRGPAPEGITTFVVGGKEIAAVTLERSNAVILFDVSAPVSRRPWRWCRRGSRRKA